MESRVEELLIALQNYAFTDSDSLLAELRSLVLSSRLSSASIAYCSSKLLNSDISLISFLKANKSHTDKLIWKTMSNILNLLSEYIKIRAHGMSEYITEIRETCVSLMASSTKSSMVQEAALRPFIKLLEHCPVSKEKIDPEGLFNILLDRKLKFEEKKMGSTLKGATYNMLGLLVFKYQADLEVRIPDLQTLMYIKIKEEVNKGSKTENRTLAGLLKGLAYALVVFTYSEVELRELFTYIKAMVQPISESIFIVPKACMKVLSTSAGMFGTLITENARSLFSQLFDLSKTGPPSMRILAQEACEKVLVILAENLQEGDIQIFGHIFKILNNQLFESEYALPSTVRSIGVFAQAIVKFKGEPALIDCLERISAFSFRFLMQEEDEDIKTNMLKQKNLAAFLHSYADIAGVLTKIPEPMLVHFSQTAILIFSTNPFLYKRNRIILYSAVAQLIAALHKQEEDFPAWIRVFVSKAMQELLKIPEDLDIEFTQERIRLSCSLWAGILEQECLPPRLIQILVDEIARYLLGLLNTLDLQYSLKEGSDIEASNSNHQQLFYLAYLFASYFFVKRSSTLLAWIMPFASLLNQKSSDLPQIGTFYKFLEILLKVSGSTDFLENDTEARNYFSIMVKDIVKRTSGFKDALLSDALEACLEVPQLLVYSAEENNLKLFAEVVNRCLSIGLSYTQLAHKALSLLNRWSEGLPKAAFQSILPSILPKLSPYLALDKGEKKLAFRVIKLLGSLGGGAHGLISENDTELHIAWDIKPRVQIDLTLNVANFTISLDGILPRLLELASSENPLKRTACELLHSVVINLIGQSGQSEIELDKIYSKLLPTVYALGSDIDPVVRQVFEPLSKQLVRWFGKFRTYEHPETIALLDTLMDGACHSSNAGIRALSASCIGEFSVTSSKHFKSLLTRILNFSNHPKTSKRHACGLCLQAILPKIQDNAKLCDRFLLEIAHSIIVISRTGKGATHEVHELCFSLLEEVIRSVAFHKEVFTQTNDKRAFHTDVFAFIDWLWEHTYKSERDTRVLAQRSWVQLADIFEIDKLEWVQRKDPALFFDELETVEANIDFLYWLKTQEIHLIADVRPGVAAVFEELPAEEQVLRKLNSILLILKYSELAEETLVPDRLLVETIVCPDSLSLFGQVDTPQYHKLYAEVRNIASRCLKKPSAKMLLEVWGTVNMLGAEKSLRNSCEGLSVLCTAHECCNVMPQITPQLENQILEFWGQASEESYRRGRLLLQLLCRFKISGAFLSRLLSSLITYQICSDILLDYVAVNWAETASPVIRAIVTRADTLLPISLPILEQVAASVTSKRLPLITFMDAFTSAATTHLAVLTLIPSVEVSIGLVKLYCVFIGYCRSLSVFSEGVDFLLNSPEFIELIAECITSFLDAGRPVDTKKEALKLVAISWGFLQPGHWANIRVLINQVQSDHLLASSVNLLQTRATADYQKLVGSFLELVKETNKLEALEFIFPILREEVSGFEEDLKIALNSYIHHLITENNQCFNDLMILFLDPGTDTSMKNNLRKAIAVRVIIPVLEQSDEATVENLIVPHATQLLETLKKNRFNEIADPRNYCLSLMEKAHIILIFEKVYDKLSSIKNIHHKLYGPSSQGNELTKELIQFCNKYRKERPERYEVLNVENAIIMLTDFASACYKFLLTCIRTTQTKDNVFMNFLFKDQVWSQFFPDKQLDFKPITSFQIEKFTGKVQRVERNSMTLDFIAGSLFSQSNTFTFEEALPKKVETEEVTSELELDEINSHMVMKPMLLVLDRMESLFKENWFDMPNWMQCLHNDLRNPNFNTFTKLFIIKLILNRASLFERWKNEWFETIVSIMTNNSGGQGFHYFLRDVCTLFLYDWEIVPTVPLVPSQFLNYLIRVGADTSRTILESNIQLISALIDKWRTCVTIDHKYVEGMMKKNFSDEKVGTSWRVLGICIFKEALRHSVRILDNLQEKSEVLDQFLVKCLDYPRKQVVLLASETIGLRLVQNPDLSEEFLGHIFKKENAVIAGIIEKVSLNYPNIFDITSLTMKMNSLISSISGSARSSLLNAIKSYVIYIKTLPDHKNLPEIAEYMHRDLERIVNDNDESHRENLLEIINHMIDLSVNPNIRKTVSAFVPHLMIYASSENSETRKALYNLLIRCYEQAELISRDEAIKIRSKARDVLLIGLSDSNVELANIAIDFWNGKLSHSPANRIVQSLWELYSSRYEEEWLLASSHLVLKLSELSNDYNKTIYKQIDNTEYTSIDIGEFQEPPMSMTSVFSLSYYQKRMTQTASQDEFKAPRRIRYEPDHVNFEKKREEIAKRHQQRVQELRQKQFQMYRSYRQGYFPDIEIAKKDMILPLSILASKDLAIASFVWSNLCTFLARNSVDDTKRKLIKGLSRILENSFKYSPIVIGCIHRTIRQIIEIYGNLVHELSHESIAKSGIKGMTYQSSAMLLQECLLRYTEDKPAKRSKSGVTTDNRHLWLALIEVYEEMADYDAVKGLWMEIFSKENSPEATSLKTAFDYKTKGELTSCLNELEELLPTHIYEKEVRKEYQETLGLLGNWEDLRNALDENSSTSLHIKTMLRNDMFPEALNLLRETDGFFYENALLCVIQNDPDRASYYLEKELFKFMETWQSLNPLSISSRRKLIGNTQKIYEFYEFIKIFNPKASEAMEDFVIRIESTLNSWLLRTPSLHFDDLKIWEELLYGRLIFYDKLVFKHELTLPNIKEYNSKQYAKTAECPLKIGWLDVASFFLKEANRNREDKSKASMSIFSPILRLKSKQILKGGFTDPIGEFEKIILTANKQRVEREQETDFALLKGILYGKFCEIIISLNADVTTRLPETARFAYDYLKESSNKLKLAKFCDKLLRVYEQNDDSCMMMGFCFNEMRVQPETLANTLVSACIDAMNEGNKRAHGMFPRILDLLKYQGVSETIQKSLKTVPSWMLIKWISQILAIINTEESDCLAESVEKLVQNFSQVVFYPYNCFMSIESTAHFHKIKEEAKGRTWKVLDEFYGSFGYLKEFSEALDCLTYPEHRFLYFYDCLKEAYNELDFEYIEYIIKNMRENLVDRVSGTYNRQFASSYGSKIDKALNPLPKNLNHFVNIMNPVYKMAQDSRGTLKAGTENLSAFSEWLADFNFSSQNPIDIPGLISGEHQPFTSDFVQIVSFNQNLLILNSMRRPKRLGVHGSDEKLYYLLVKGGEDLRLDQRIQQIFSIMNQIFEQDPDCKKQGINLRTFGVIPITKSLGVLEWVPHTKPLRAFIDIELQRHHNIQDLTCTDAYKSRLSWLSSLGNLQRVNAESHLIALREESFKIITSFRAHENQLPWDLIRQVVLGMSTTPESFLYIRSKFINSLAAISVAGYVLGIGDRHLENFLLNMRDGQLMAIDFGIAFGSGLNLPVPELTPFRLTNQLLNLLLPEGSKGQFRHSMIHALRALRAHKNVIIDCCEVFIKEPLLDWVKDARSKELAGGSFSQASSLSQPDIQWLPMQKIAVLTKKLEGWNCAKLMVEELKETQHMAKEYADHLLQCVLGPPGSRRRTEEMSGLTVDVQVDLLIEHATDPGILGRTWIGWQPTV